MPITNDRKELHQFLLREANRELQGLDIPPEGIKVYDVARDGEGGAVWWSATGQHGNHIGTFDNPGQEFLGWQSTARVVKVDFVSLLVTAALPHDAAGDEGSDAPDDEARRAHHGWVHSWDKLTALAQMGVKAVGRPVLR